MRGYDKILNSKITLCLLSTVWNCSTKICCSRYFKIVIIISFVLLTEAWKKFWYNLNIAQINFMRFIRVHFFHKKYLPLNCVVYRLTLVLIMQAMGLLNSCSQWSSKLVFLKFSKILQETPPLKLLAFRSATLLKKNSNTGVFVWNLPNSDL